MRFIDMACQLPDSFQSRTEPEALVPNAHKRIGVLSDNRIPNVGATGECWVTSELTGQLPIQVEPKCQNHIQAESSRNQHFDQSEMTLSPSAVNCRDYQTSDDQAYARSHAAGEPEQPDCHCDERDVDQNNSSDAPLLTVGPAREGVPDKVNPADHAYASEHVLACRSSYKLCTTRPCAVLSGHIWVVLDE